MNTSIQTLCPTLTVWFTAPLPIFSYIWKTYGSLPVCLHWGLSHPIFIKGREHAHELLPWYAAFQKFPSQPNLAATCLLRRAWTASSPQWIREELIMLSSTWILNAQQVHLNTAGTVPSSPGPTSAFTFPQAQTMLVRTLTIIFWPFPFFYLCKLISNQRLLPTVHATDFKVLWHTKHYMILYMVTNISQLYSKFPPFTFKLPNLSLHYE